MYADALPYLRCIACGAGLRLERPVYNADDIVSGALGCAGCGASFPVREGVADFLGPPRPPTPAQLTNEWPATAWVYERAWRPFALTLLARERFPYRRELPLVMGMLRPERGGLLLDVACSNGLYARAMARTMRGATGHVVAVDHALPMLLEGRRRAHEGGLRITFVRAKAQALPVSPGAATGVAVGGSLNEIGDLDACLAEVRRALAPGGHFAAMTLARAATPPGRLVQQALGPGGVVFWTPDELAAYFARHGLRTIRREQHGIVLFTLAI
ncbi:MAG: hypothetical protein RLZZ387_2114 [Chloroflexota bacterium]|jgi:SAM-dependent methyltransferase